VAFDKKTGKEIWRALSTDGDLGVNQPIIVTAAKGKSPARLEAGHLAA